MVRQSHLFGISFPLASQLGGEGDWDCQWKAAPPSTTSLTREENHVKAIEYFSEGKLYEAAYTWEDILAQNPTDPIALRFASDM